METKLANEIEIPTKTFEAYHKKVDILQPGYLLTINELKQAFFSISPGHDEICYNVIKSCFGSLSKPLLHIFRLSLEEGRFPDDLKTARVTPIFKAGDENEFGNYRPISVLSCFFKILETIMCKRLRYFIRTHFNLSKAVWFSTRSLNETCYNATYRSN